MFRAGLNRAFIHIASLLVGLSVAAAATQAEPLLIPAPPQLAASGYLLIDADTGEVLVEHNSEELLPPASLTKMMTSYLVSKEIANGTIHPEDMVNISVKAWRMGGSKMFIREGTKVSVMDLLKGVIIQSGNDASVALAEHIAGSEEAFVDLMNQQAALLGMHHTVFKNSTGWPAEGHVTTARDLATLSRALIREFPEHYALYAEKYFAYNGINQANRNRLLFRDPTVDGIKTGHTDEAGYCLVSSAVRDDMRLIAVIMGTRSEEARAVESQKLLTYGFRYFQTHKLYNPSEEISTARVWSGLEDNLALGVADEVFLTIPRGAHSRLKATMHVDGVIKAPIAMGQELGNITVELDGKQLLDVPLVAKDAIDRAGFLSRTWDGIKLFFLNLFGML